MSNAQIITGPLSCWFYTATDEANNHCMIIVVKASQQRQFLAITPGEKKFAMSFVDAISAANELRHQLNPTTLSALVELRSDDLDGDCLSLLAAASYEEQLVMLETMYKLSHNFKCGQLTAWAASAKV